MTADALAVNITMSSATMALTIHHTNIHLIYSPFNLIIELISSSRFLLPCHKCKELVPCLIPKGPSKAIGEVECLTMRRKGTQLGLENMVGWELPEGPEISKHCVKKPVVDCCVNDINGLTFLWYVNFGSGNGLLPSGNKPLPEPSWPRFLFTYIVVRRLWINGLFWQ